MEFFCNSCEKNRSFEYDYGILIITAKNGIKRNCRLCRTPKPNAPDIFWDGKPEEGLADDPVTGKPRVFGSKAEKAAYLRERGLVEAGDKYHGAPISFSNNVPRGEHESKHEVKMALKKVKEMGALARRQAYLKLVKENGKYAMR